MDMEEHFPLDISIRNVDVRLKDTKVTPSEMNGESIGSSYSNGPEEGGDCSKNCGEVSPDICEEAREKLHISKELLNGCSKLFHDDMKYVDFSLNGLIKCSNLERYDKSTYRTCTTEDNRTGNVESERTQSNHEQEDSAKSENTLLPVLELSCPSVSDVNIAYLGYDSESRMPDIMRLIQKDLSEPYSIYTYRYFIHNWPKLCFLAQDGNRCVGAIVCKLDVHKKHIRRGYIAMLAVDEKYRKRKIGSNLVLKAIHAMVQDNADEVVLETEITNKPALRLYENLGFVRDKRLFRYYLNGVDALRLKLWLR